ncbi:MAG: hypothetical protein JSV26_06020 [bacterium]|nr:MAG: hypothetical protein JSV26_06020 [bacterium]
MDTLQSLIRSRGLSIDRWNPEEELLVPGRGVGEEEKYMSLLDHYAARLLLREAIKCKSPSAWIKGRRAVERFCAPEAFDGFLTQFFDLGVLIPDETGRPLPRDAVGSFGGTYEWYVSQVLRRDFGCPSAWGVRFGGLDAGGDHDVVAIVSGRFLYMEVKTAPPKHVDLPEIASFVRRIADIGPDFAILHEDTHLRMKDKIVPLMVEALSSAAGVEVTFERLEREIFHLAGMIYVVNSKPDLRRNLKLVFRHHFMTGNPLAKMLISNMK